MKAVKKVEEIGRQSWLAGVGVFDLSRSKTIENVDKLFVDSNAFINELVSKGELVEKDLQAKLRGRVMIDEQIAALKAKLGIGKESKEMKLDKLSNKVDRLIEAVAVLAQQKEAELASKPKAAAKPKASPAPKATAARSTTAKTAAAKTKTTKTTATKSTTTKPPASKAAPKTTRATAAKATVTATKPANTTKAPAKPRVRKTPVATPKPASDDTEE